MSVFKVGSAGQKISGYDISRNDQVSIEPPPRWERLPVISRLSLTETQIQNDCERLMDLRNPDFKT